MVQVIGYKYFKGVLYGVAATCAGGFVFSLTSHDYPVAIGLSAFTFIVFILGQHVEEKVPGVNTTNTDSTTPPEVSKSISK